MFIRMTLVSVVALSLSIFETAQAIVINATADIWMRESAPDTTYENDLLSVWNSFGGDAGTRRYGVLEFDVSSLDQLTIESAFLGLYGTAHGYSDETKAIKQSAFLIDTTGGTQTTAMTWNAYQNEYAGSAVALEGLGSYNLEAPTPVDQFLDSDATAADRALIASVANSSGGGNQLFTMVFVADEMDGVEYAHSWGDGNFGGFRAELVINEVRPYTDLALTVNTATGDVAILNQENLDDPVSFDLDGYVIQSALGNLVPDPSQTPGVGWDSLATAGLPGWQEVAPTANALSEVNLTMSTTVADGSSLDLGKAFSAGAMEEDWDLTFEYSLEGLGTFTGDVVYEMGAAFDEADFNRDGSVDGDDFLLWQTGFGTTSGAMKNDGDYDNDGDVDGDDFLGWQAEFGNAAGSGSGAVPEPASLLLFVAAVMGLVAGRRRWHFHVRA